ncbi:hypothetical protein DIPPA_65685 [Diplonema papillatum]|nr:hypothetical protein DIPPA_65686 [Diplonema papillatum]KAJ9449803.1 hypothetical protein DIPPA_65685 [Diplonema papillatum]
MIPYLHEPTSLLGRGGFESKMKRQSNLLKQYLSQQEKSNPSAGERSERCHTIPAPTPSVFVAKDVISATPTLESADEQQVRVESGTEACALGTPSCDENVDDIFDHLLHPTERTLSHAAVKSILIRTQVIPLATIVKSIEAVHDRASQQGVSWSVTGVVCKCGSLPSKKRAGGLPSKSGDHMKLSVSDLAGTVVQVLLSSPNERLKSGTVAVFQQPSSRRVYNPYTHETTFQLTADANRCTVIGQLQNLSFCPAQVPRRDGTPGLEVCGAPVDQRKAYQSLCAKHCCKGLAMKSSSMICGGQGYLAQAPTTKKKRKRSTCLTDTASTTESPARDCLGITTQYKSARRNAYTIINKLQ